MNSSTQGGPGVLHWVNSIRFNMARDPDRQLLHEQIQNTMDFLDGYLENVLKGPKAESVAELLKTPGRKKNAPARARSATAATARKETVIGLSLDRTDHERENHAPVNNFHKALLQMKTVDTDAIHDSIPVDNVNHQASRNVDAIVQEAFIDKPGEPAVNALEQEEEIKAQDSLNPPGASPEVAVNELSMIAEDDELAERSRLSALPPSSTTEVAQQLELHSSEAEATTPTVNAQGSMEVDEQAHGVVMSTTDTFHSIPLDSPPQTITAPVDPSPTGEKPEGLQEPIPIIQSGAAVDELRVPIRDEPSVSSLNRTPGLSQVGLPAPSPLHKSTRTGIEPSTGPAPAAGGKRGSWLVKAREVKAMEMTGKRTSSAPGTVLGLGVLSAKGKSGETMDLQAVPSRLVEEERVAKRKSGEMMDVQGLAEPSRGAEEERVAKVAKLSDGAGDSAARKARLNQMWAEEPSVSPRAKVQPQVRASTVPPEDFIAPIQADEQEELLLDTFKKRVEGARYGKSIGKSLGGTAAAALAEARAAAEARVAERHKLERGSDVGVPGEENAGNTSAVPAPSEEVPVPDSHKRLSLSDLVGPSKKKEQSPAGPSNQGEPPLPALNIEAAGKADSSVSTTPPNSPPSRSAALGPPPLPSGPVFSKPPTVFVAPSAASSSAQTSHPPAITTAGSGKDFSFKLPTANPFSLPTAMTLGVPAKLSPGSQRTAGGLSAHSSKGSLFSDAIFDKEDSIPAWMPQTQDTEYTQQSESQPKFDDTDDDDSWHVDDKFAGNQMWTPFGFTSGSGENRDDTWSTLPSRSTSQKGGDTGFVTMNFTQSIPATKVVDQLEEAPLEAIVQPSRAEPVGLEANPESTDFGEHDIADVAMETDEVEDEDMIETDLEDMVEAGKSTVGLVQAKSGLERSQSQQSVTSTASSSQQSQMGLFGHASKFVSSVLGGGSKKKAEPIKSLQLATQAAKKQQGEIEKKNARLKEMENRRQLALQRKAEEEQARAQEEERKIKEENERRKREREDHTDKRPISRMATKKPDEDNTKKRKIAETEKKPVESKKLPSKDKKDNPSAPRTVKPGPSTGPPGMKIGPPPKSAAKQPEINEVKVTAKTVKGTPSSSNLKSAPSSSNLKVGPPKGKGKAPIGDGDEEQPAQAIRAQMKTQAQAQLSQPPPIPSESIELPDINSEYSDSEDEDRPRTFDPPDWAQSPELRTALEQQATVNPDEVFGRIAPLRMEELFRTRQSRFRARTSSANWSGPDGLTAEEEREYARRMGFK